VVEVIKVLRRPSRFTTAPPMRSLWNSPPAAVFGPRHPLIAWPLAACWRECCNWAFVGNPWQVPSVTSSGVPASAGLVVN
jgi:hypothetical protein